MCLCCVCECVFEYMCICHCALKYAHVCVSHTHSVSVCICVGNMCLGTFVCVSLKYVFMCVLVIMLVLACASGGFSIQTYRCQEILTAF